MSAMLKLSWADMEVSCVIDPQHVNMLVGILERVCADKGMARDGDEAGLLASRLVNLFQAGVTDEQALFAVVTGRK